MFKKKDVIAQAQSGTGKTGCFTIGTLQRIDISSNTTQAIVISPTRELSIQTKNVFDSIGSMMKGLTSHLLIGGTSIDTDIQTLSSSNPHILIGCPGRIHDMMRRKKLNLRTCKIIIVDEPTAGLDPEERNRFLNLLSASLLFVVLFLESIQTHLP